ncbi:hypothetical protein AVEN_230478-1 [Araneus ventricosus]|uniref:Uncharacterized protein n=1 Tax=Araneus ventricosus TaxID=182803 RepID=A0A4Y2J184_ARAVE|nr:hypothetical protein AVEN_230478-1 [Araneus ventricosus]
MRQFCLLTKPTRLKYASSENHVSNIDITLIHKMQHSVCEIIACINGIHTQELARLDLVRKHVKVVAHDTVRGHSSESSTRCNTANGCPGLL